MTHRPSIINFLRSAININLKEREKRKNSSKPKKEEIIVEESFKLPNTANLDEENLHRKEQKKYFRNDVSKNGDLMKEMDLDLIDEDILRIAIENKKHPSSYLSSAMRKNFKIAFWSTELDSDSIEYFDPILRREIHIMLNCVKNNGMLLKYSSKNLKDDSFLVLQAWNNNSKSIIHASDRIYDNPHLLVLENLEFVLIDERIIRFYNISFNFVN
eukprot:gene12552-6372_t